MLRGGRGENLSLSAQLAAATTAAAAAKKCLKIAVNTWRHKKWHWSMLYIFKQLPHNASLAPISVPATPLALPHLLLLLFHLHLPPRREHSSGFTRPLSIARVINQRFSRCKEPATRARVYFSVCEWEWVWVLVSVCVCECVLRCVWEVLVYFTCTDNL